MAPAYTAAEFQGEHPSVPTHSPSSHFPQVFRGNFQEVSYRFIKKKKTNKQKKTEPFLSLSSPAGTSPSLGPWGLWGRNSALLGAASDVLPAINRVEEGSVPFRSYV